jgi:hypothetical protein
VAGRAGPADRAARAGPADYSQTPLPRKLGISEDDEVALIGAPDDFYDTLGELPEVSALHTDLADDARYDVIIAFVTERAELAAELPRLRSRMAPACGLWIAWPKRASNVPTDVSDQVVREIALSSCDLVDNKVCSIDTTWSALRLVIRREHRPRDPAPGRRKQRGPGRQGKGGAGPSAE